MGTVSQACPNMKAFVIGALVAAVAGEADPYTIGQVLAGQTNGGVLTSTTYHGGVKVAGFPYTTVAAPVVSHAYAGYPYAYYGKREAEVILIKTITIMAIHIINHHCCCCQCHHHNQVPMSNH